MVADSCRKKRFRDSLGWCMAACLASLLDEALSRTALLYGEWVMTGRLEIRYRQPAVVGQVLRVTAEIESARAGWS